MKYKLLSECNTEVNVRSRTRYHTIRTPTRAAPPQMMCKKLRNDEKTFQPSALQTKTKGDVGALQEAFSGALDSLSNSRNKWKNVEGADAKQISKCLAVKWYKARDKYFQK